jgi:hypothetical protein
VSIEQEVPVSSSIKSHSNIQNRRPPPPPPPPISTHESNKIRLSRKCSRSNSIIDTQQQRASSAVAPRTLPTTTIKRVPLKEEHLLKRSSSADRVGRERWLHHITDSAAINTGLFYSS